MPTDRLILRSRRVVTDDGVAAADVIVEGERILGVEPLSSARPSSAAVEDLGDLMLMAGMVDPHVHINEPGRTEWEGFAHATRAAAAGGATTLADMPLNSDPVTTTLAALAAKRAAAAGQCWVDVGFHAGLVPSNARHDDQLEAIDRAGVLAWKAFLCDSGIADFAPVTRDDLEAAMPILASAGARLLVHAELLPTFIGALATTPATPARSESYLDWESSRPPEWEIRAIEVLISLCRSTRCAVHVVHLSAADALPLLRRARREGLPLTVETCPHYLHFAAEDLPDRDARFKCAPPIRGRENRDALWIALADGTIDLVASDHSPSPPSMKETPDGSIGAAWGGIASLQLTLPVVWTGARARGIAPEQLALWLCRRPAELLGLAHDRGTLTPGKIASLTAWDPEHSFTVDPARLLNRHPSTSPYAGERLYGVVERTWLRGRLVARRGEIVVGEPAGILLSRPTRSQPAATSEPAIQRGTAGSPSSFTLAALRRLPRSAQGELLARCCAARVWIEAMLFGLTESDGVLDRGDLFALTERSFDLLRREDWLEAFAGHPRIGDLESLRHRFSSTRELAAGEQSGTRGASDRVLRALAQGNADYERRFGHLFIVCATGKNASEMLDLLQQRLGNEPDSELAIAAAEQRKITRLRLAGLLADASEKP